MLRSLQFTVVFILMVLCATAQENIHNYKYIIIPKKFDFSQTADQYQLNSLTKFLFNKYGYEAYFLEDELPEDFKLNRCLGLTAEVSNEESGLFKTKVNIVLKDCFGSTVLSSEVGESRKKEFDKAYTEAIRAAFETFKTIDYAYVPQKLEQVLVEEIKTEREVFEQKSEITELESGEEVILNPIDTEELYYAQPIKNGFQLVNAKPEIVMVLLQTSAPNVFLVKGKSAIVFKEDEFWFYSENSGSLKAKQQLNIKF